MEKKGFNYRNLFKNKKAEGDNLLFPEIMFIILNLVVFGVLLMFVYNSSTGALVYEQAYAKQIALMLDSAKPYSRIVIDFSKGIEIAEKNKLEKEKTISFKDNKLNVKLSSQKGYTIGYFSDYEVNSYFDGNSLIINVNEKTGS